MENLVEIKKKYKLKNIDEYIKIVKRPYPPLFMSLLQEGQATGEYFTHFIPNWSYIHQLVTVDKDNIYYVREEMDTLGREMLEIFSNKEIFEESVKRFEEQESKLLDATSTNFDNYILEYMKYVPSLQVLSLQGI